jgi:hypothetical protein
MQARRGLALDVLEGAGTRGSSVRLTPLASATLVLALISSARAQEPAPAPEQPPAPAPEQTPAPAPAPPPGQAPAPLTQEERIRLLEERLAALEKTPPAPPALEERVGTLEATLRNVVSAVADQVKVTGLVSGSYTWNLADPPGRRGTNLLRVSDPDHDTFAVTYAKLGLYRDLSGENDWDAGFRVELAAGRLVEQTLSLDPDFNGGDEVNLANAYVQLQAPTPLGRPLTITAGRFYGWFGVESLDVPTNPNFSLSYFSNFTPFSNTGVGVGLELVDGLRYTQYVVNGWDLVFDNNDSKSYGGQLALTLDEPATTVALNWLVGAEQRATRRTCAGSSSWTSRPRSPRRPSSARRSTTARRRGPPSPAAPAGPCGGSPGTAAPCSSSARSSWRCARASGASRSAPAPASGATRGARSPA